MSDSAVVTRRINDTPVPLLLYGTAWKEEETERLVHEALLAGFRGIDTANQRRHYFEAGVGHALKKAFDSGLCAREALFLQTKFTYAEGQDHRLPFDPSADYPTQVRQSFESSLSHLGADRLESYLLHGPRTGRGLTRGDVEVWKTMEELKREGRVQLIGVSNVSAEQLAALCEMAEILPAFVQNRCFARLGWDRAVRDVCRANGVVYQGFSLLTANQHELRRTEIRAIAERHQATVPQVVFRFASQLGMICLTGTTDPGHMREDLSMLDLELSGDEISAIETISG